MGNSRSMLMNGREIGRSHDNPKISKINCDRIHDVREEDCGPYPCNLGSEELGIHRMLTAVTIAISTSRPIITLIGNTIRGLDWVQ